MKKIYTFLLVSVLLLFLKQSYGQIPPGYYDSAEGLSGYTLKTALFNIIKDHDNQGYSALWGLYAVSDKLPPELTNSGYATNKIWDIYSYNPNGPNPYEFTIGSNQCGNYSAEGDCYNREHTFPKSWFNNAAPMKSDALHILPTDGYVNGRRSNWPYSEVGSTTWISENGSKLGTSNVPGYSGTAFEPIDEFKGDLARIYFYMATRYQNLIAGWENNSANADAVLDGTSNHVFENWFLNLMVKWHNQDPVSVKETNRNNAVYDFQHNRNPFVDHPEYVSLIWVDPSAINDVWETTVSVFPNPTTDFLHINLSSSEELQCVIYNMTGQIMLETTLTEKQNSVETKRLEKGLYLLLLKSNNGKFFRTSKFLKR